MKPLFVAQDPWQCICSHFDECIQLGNLAQVNKALHTLVGIESKQGAKSIWLHLGLQITGYSRSKLSFDINHPHFKRCIQLLLCPWLSEPRPLSFKIPLESMTSNEIWRVRISPLDNNTLHYEMRRRVYDDNEDEMRDADAPEVQYLLPSSPDEIEHRGEFFTGSVPLLAREEHDAELKRMLTVVKRDGLLMHTCKVPLGNHLSLRLVHGGALAVISGLRKQCVEYQCSNGERKPKSMMILRFFSAKTLRFLRAILCENVKYMEEVDACFQPCKMWVLNSKRILYYGPDHTIDQQLICDLKEHKSGLMDPAFWILYGGDATSAARYIKYHLKLDINQPNLYSFDNLLFCVLKMSRPKPSAILQLLGEGVDIETRDEENRTPLMVACALLLVDCVRILLFHGNANPHAVCGKGQTAAFYVGRSHHYLLDDEEEQACKILNILHDVGVNMNQRDNQGSIPFFQRTLLLNLECVQLIASFPDFNAHVIDTQNGYTALHYIMQYCGRATFTQAQRVMYLLVKGYGLDINIQSKDGQTPLMIASDAPNPTHVYMLLEWFGNMPQHQSQKLKKPSELICEAHFQEVLSAARSLRVERHHDRNVFLSPTP